MTHYEVDISGSNDPARAKALACIEYLGFARSLGILRLVETERLRMAPEILADWLWATASRLEMLLGCDANFTHAWLCRRYGISVEGQNAPRL